MVIGLLGILKAGAAYLPLEPSLPPERLRLMIEDARPRLVLAQLQHPGPPTEGGPPLVDLSEAIASGADPVGPSPVRPDNLAYVIYTSGSTGGPRAS